MVSNRNSATTIAKNTVYMFIRMLLVAAVSFYTSRVILKVLGVEDYGIYNIVGSVVVFLSFFKNALTNATYRYIAYDLGNGDRVHLKKLFSMSLNAHCILAIILFVVLEIGGVWFLNHKLNIPDSRIYAANWVFQFSLLTFCIEVIKTPYNSMIIANERLSFYAWTSIIEVIFKLGIVYLLQCINVDKLILYALLLSLVSLIMYTWYKLYNNRHFEETIYKYYWDNDMLKNLISYSGWSVVVNAADVSVTQCISIFLNLFFGVIANAAMGIANQVNALFGQFLSTFSTSYNPQIIKSYASGDYDYFMKLLFSTSKLSFFLTFAIAFPIMLNIEYILSIWLGNPPEMAGIFLICIACHLLFDSFSVPLWNAVHATGNLKTHQILMSCIKIMNIPLGYWLLSQGYPSYSILILYATLNGICAVVRIIYLKSLIGLKIWRFFREVIFKLLIVVIVSIPLPMYLHDMHLYPIVSLIISSTIFFFIYGLCIYFMGLTQQERLLAFKIMRK